MKIVDNDILYPDLILAILPYRSNHYFFSDVTYRIQQEIQLRDLYKDQIIDLPILKDTVIKKYHAPKEIF